MATTPANATNALTTGQVSFSGTAFSASTLTQFDVLVGGASNAISSIGPGTAGQVLQSAGNAANPAYSTATYPATAGTSGNVISSNGTNFVSSTPSSIGGSLTLLATTTAASSASITFSSSLITSTYRVYLLIWSRMVAQTNGTTLQLTFSTDNGSSYLASGYQGTCTVFSWNSATVNNNNTTAYCPMTQATGFSNTTEASGYIYLYDLAISGATTVLGMLTENSNVYGITGCGLTSANTVNNIKIASSSGNLASGTIALYGVS